MRMGMRIRVPRRDVGLFDGPEECEIHRFWARWTRGWERELDSLSLFLFNFLAKEEVCVNSSVPD
jgi:hypothetical protein